MTDKPEKTFTQTELNRMLANAKREHQAELERVREELEQHKTVADAAREEVASLQRSMDSLKSEHASALARAERTSGEKVQDLERRLSEAEPWRARYRQRELDVQMGAAFDEVRVMQTAKADFGVLFKAAAQVETDDDFKVTAVKLEGADFPTLRDAAEAFLKARPHYLSAGAPPVRQDQKPPNRGSVHTSKLSDLPPERLAEMSYGRD